MNNKTTTKKMSYLDKIKNNKNRVQKRAKKMKQQNTVPKGNVITINGAQKPKQDSPGINVTKESSKKDNKDDESTFSISVSAPKQNGNESNAASSDRSLNVNKDDKKNGNLLFKKKKEEMKFDSDKELSDKNIQLNVNKPKKSSHFGHKRKQSKSQRDTLKMVIDQNKNTKSQKKLKRLGIKRVIFY
jgi:hypothetical protein